METANTEKPIISTDPEMLDVPYIHQFLTNAYWAKGRTLEEVENCIKNSFNFGISLGGKQIGFARVISDFVVFAYLMDVFIDEKFRAKGYSKLLVENILNHPKLKNIKMWRLGTSDAHGLYSQFGFKPLEFPEKMMELKR
jgi:N-acetylglutamate synthase-like GNAT family acetyltransferase